MGIDEIKWVLVAYLTALTISLTLAAVWRTGGAGAATVAGMVCSCSAPRRAPGPPPPVLTAFAFCKAWVGPSSSPA